MSPTKKSGRGSRDDDATSRVDTTTLNKLRRESQTEATPDPVVEFGGTTDSLDDDLLRQLKEQSQRTSAQAPAVEVAPAAPPVARFPEQPVIEELGGWSSASSGEFSFDIDLDSLPEHTPLAPPADSASVLPTVKATDPELYPVVAIDFGTSYSGVAVLHDGKPRLLPRPTGCIPSMVGIREDGFTVVGEEARQMRVSDPANVVPSPKRFLGRSHRDRELEPHLANLALQVTEGPHGDVVFGAREQAYSVEQICATVLYRLRQYAQDHIGQEVTEAVFAVPVDYGTTRTKALTRAAGIAGLTVLKTIEEPAAAALANHDAAGLRGLAAVYDFGGGTFDFSVLDVDSGLTVVATAGNSWLGGDDFDEALAGAVANAFWRQRGVELRNQVVQWQRLLWASERTKRSLSSQNEAKLSLDNAALTDDGGLKISVTISREQFANLVQGLIARSLETCRQALKESGIERSRLNAVYMSGGTSLVPAVREAVATFFGQAPVAGVAPDQAVLLGAASYLGLLRAVSAIA